MFTWAEIILAALKLINAIMGAVNQDKWTQAGYDKAIAEISTEILRKTSVGKAMLEKVNAMSDADVDAEFRGLEPK
jgi:hypothetical protein